MGDKVDVTLAVNQGTKIPSSRLRLARLAAAARLTRRRPEPRLHRRPLPPPGATIAESHTAVPVSTDEVLKELQHTLNTINPNAVGNLVSNLATDLDGQGANLNKLIASAAGTVQLLADKGNDLGQLNGTLAQLTGTLDTDTAQIEHLVEQYDTVSTHPGPALGAAQRRHHPAGRRQLQPREPARAQPAAARGGRRDGDDGGPHAGPQSRLGRRDPPERQQPVPGGQAGLRPELQLARPQPRRPPRA